MIRTCGSQFEVEFVSSSIQKWTAPPCAYNITYPLSDLDPLMPSTSITGPTSQEAGTLLLNSHEAKVKGKDQKE